MHLKCLDLINDNSINSPVTLNIITKSVTPKNKSILINFTTEIITTFFEPFYLYFNIKKYSNNTKAQLIGSTYIFYNNSNVAKTKNFSFQFLDTDLEPIHYSYSIEVTSTIFSKYSIGFVIPNPMLTLTPADD